MLRKTITAVAIATVMGGVGATSAQAGSYTLPNGTRITTAAPKHTVQRTTLEQFRAKYNLRGYTMPDGTRITFASRTLHVAHRSTLQEFRAKYGLTSTR